MTELTLERIETQTTSSNLERGKSYFYSGQVNDFKITNDRFIQAIVNGSKNYRVFLEINDNSYKAYCNCPYDSKGYCKHQVAVKFALMEAPDSADRVDIPERHAKLLTFLNRLYNLYYKAKYKLF